jgi:sulfatase maturation enzyme AslB (radical SAM superfamily)
MQLQKQAQSAIDKWHGMATTDFAPTCLTLYLNNECNLGCTYCYAKPTPTPAPRLKPEEIRAGAKLIAENCARRDARMTTVFHGGGEPMLHLSLTQEALSIVQLEAQEHDVDLFRYIATNGVMSESKSRWMAQHFDLVGLSCDGPAGVQSQQRPLWRGGDSSKFVELTAQVVHDAGTPLHVRVTVTPETIDQQSEIAQYICEVLKPEAIRVEPIYEAGRAQSDDCIDEGNADHFVTEYLKAQQVAKSYGISWSFSGSRPWEIHGPYCHVFRDVLNLVPGGAATACFKTTTLEQTRAEGVLVGEMGSDGNFALHDNQKIQALRKALRVFPDKCTNCFNQYHCVRDCPDYCPLQGTTPASEFGCFVQKMLSNIMIWDAAMRLYADKPASEFAMGGYVTAS